MFQQCWPSKYNCQIHFHGNGGRSHTSTPGSTVPTFQTYGTGPGNAALTAGRSIENFGTLKQVESLTAAHPIERKIWTNVTRAEHIDIKKRSRSNPMSTTKIDDYDYRPSNSALNRQASRKQRFHRRRMPLSGQYSVAPKGSTKVHRMKLFGKATTIKYSGTAVKGLGYFYFGYIAYEAVKNPKKIPQLLLSTLYNTVGLPAYGGQQSRDTSYHMADQAGQSYFARWNRGLSE